MEQQEDGASRDYSGALMAGNLPSALSRLVGRAQELAELQSLLAGTRLLTLAGTGGCGKTRLALATAHACGHEFSGGRWWVDLSSVAEPEQVTVAAAAALGVAQSPGEQTTVSVSRHLGRRTALLVLDNCEQVVDSCAAFIDSLLRSCSGLRVLATSREVIGLPGETVFRLRGLRLPSAGVGQGSEAVELFTERARAASPGFRAGPAEVAAIGRLCGQLDGLPLAIELAAARVSILSVSQIAERLDQDPRLLRHPSRAAPPRHQTLQAALDWSHLLLTSGEQVLFRRLSVFRGSFSLPAAEAVAAGSPVEPQDLIDLMAGLVGKSLVIVTERGDGYRYQMLETIRQYGEGKLAQSGEQPQIEAAHAEFYLSFAAEGRAGLLGSDEARWLQRLEAEHDNVVAVLARTVAGEPGVAASMAGLLWPFWYRRGYYDEARSWLEQVVSVAAARPVGGEVLAGALSGAGVLAFLQCDYPVAIERLTKARGIYEEIGDGPGLATTLGRLGSIAREQGRYGDARRLHEESKALWAELGDEMGVVSSVGSLGFTAWLAGDAVRAVRLCRQAVAAFEAAGRRQDMASLLGQLGVAERMTGAPEEAGRHLRASLEICRQLSYQEGIAWALHELAVIVAGDDLAGAAGMLSESLEIHLRLGDRWRAASVVESIAELMTGGLDAATAAAMLGGSDALRRSMGAPVPLAERPALDACLRRLRESLGGPAFGQAWQAGQAWSLAGLAETAARAATDLTAAHQAPAAGQLAALGLTSREVAVLRLVSRGLTNREIGQELAISSGTAGVHVSNLLRKLGVTSRVQAATAAQRLGL